jgi:hypothetical protein
MTVSMRSMRTVFSRGGERQQSQEGRDWMLVCLNFDAGEQRVATMETHEGARVFGKSFLTDRRLICTRRTPQGLYVAHSTCSLADAVTVTAFPREKTMVVHADRQPTDLIVRARSRKVSTAQFERFAGAVRDGVAAVTP